MARALVILAEDFEELEAVTIMDLLVRAKVEVVRAGLNEGPVRASRNTVIVPDVVLDEVMDQDFDLVALPGGLPGADHLAEDPRVVGVIRRQVDKRGIVGAICAAPRALVKAGVVKGKSLTCYPHALDEMDTSETTITDEAVTVDLPLITSRGPGTAIDFTLTLIDYLKGKTIRHQVEKGLVRH